LALFVSFTAFALSRVRFYLANQTYLFAQSPITALELAAYVCVFLGNSKGWFCKGPPPADINVF